VKCSWNGNEGAVAKKKEQRPEGDASVLPSREAMTLISPSPSVGFIPDLSSLPDAGAAQDAAVDAQGSASGEESMTSEDRSEHFENRDSASSQT